MNTEISKMSLKSNKPTNSDENFVEILKEFEKTEDSNQLNNMNTSQSLIDAENKNNLGFINSGKSVSFEEESKNLVETKFSNFKIFFEKLSIFFLNYWKIFKKILFFIFALYNTIYIPLHLAFENFNFPNYFILIEASYIILCLIQIYYQISEIKKNYHLKKGKVEQLSPGIYDKGSIKLYENDYFHRKIMNNFISFVIINLNFINFINNF